MARVARVKGAVTGAYRYLVEAEETAFRRHEDRQRKLLWNGCHAEPYPRQQRLDAVRGGRPVEVFALDLPAGAAARTFAGPFDRVVVSLDDSVSPAGWNARAWLDENGL